jgi:hypothetical protein
MGEVIDLLAYKAKKEDDEISRLRAELYSLIEDMGGIHTVPMMMLDDTTWSGLLSTGCYMGSSHIDDSYHHLPSLTKDMTKDE